MWMYEEAAKTTVQVSRDRKDDLKNSQYGCTITSIVIHGFCLHYQLLCITEIADKYMHYIEET